MATAGLILNTIGLGFSILVIWYFALTSLSVKRNEKIVSDLNSEYTNPQYSTFTQIGYMQVETKDKHTVLLDIILEYDYSKEAQAELIAKVAKLKDFTRQYFATKNSIELKPENENKIKQEMVEILNTSHLDIAKITGILFNKFYVMKY